MHPHPLTMIELYPSTGDESEPIGAWLSYQIPRVGDYIETHIAGDVDAGDPPSMLVTYRVERCYWPIDALEPTVRLVVSQ